MRLTKTWKIVIGIAVVVAVVGTGCSIYMVRASHNPAFCGTCHIIRPYYQSWSNSSLLANKHAQKNVACLDCHESSYWDKVKEGFKFITGRYETPLPELKVPKEKCLECHESYEKVAELTAHLDPNPHDNPHQEGLECNVCHKMHKESELYCSKCHSFDLDI